MSFKLHVAALALLLAAVPALAQINPFANNAQSFDEADRNLMYGSMIKVLDSQTVGTTAEWTSTEGTFGGVSELLTVESQDGMRCGTLRHQFKDLVAGDAVQPDVSRYDIRACEVPGEGWKFAF